MLKNTIKDMSDFIRIYPVTCHHTTFIYTLQVLFIIIFFFVMSENLEAFISHSVYKRNQNLQYYIHVQLGK